MDSDQFEIGLASYAWVVALSSIAGIVRFLNVCVKTNKFHMLVLIKDLMTGILSGLMAFWICQYFGLVGPLSNVAVAIAGVMGVQAIDEIKNVVFTILNAYTKK